MMDYISLSELSDYLHFQAEVSKDNMTAQKNYIKQGFQFLPEKIGEVLHYIWRKYITQAKQIHFYAE